MQMQGEPSMMLWVSIAIAIALLAAFVLWLPKHMANEQTRSQGITMAAIALGVLVLGFFVTQTSTEVRLAPPASTQNVTTTIERDGHMVVHTHRGHLSEARTSATIAGRGHSGGQAVFAWGPLTLAVIAVGLIVLVVSSKKGLAAALAGLGIVAALLVMYLWTARRTNVQHIVETARIRESRAAAEAGFDQVEARVRREPLIIENAAPASTAGTTKVAAESSPTDVQAEAEATPAAELPSADGDETATAKSPPPDWIGREPAMESGVYQAVVVSGPYATKRECLQRLEGPARDAIREYANDYSRPATRHYAWGNWYYIRDHLIEERYFEQVQTSVGPMWNLHALLKIDQGDVAYFDRLAHEFEVRQAVELASLGGLSVLGVLVVLYGGLRYAGRNKRTGASASATEATT